MALFARHWNGNLLCSIDVETTGLNPEKHEIIQLAILPLNHDYTLSKEFKYLDLRIMPENIREIEPELHGKMRDKVTDARLHGMEKWSAVDYFDDWFNKLRLRPGRKIIPLGCNYCFDRDFIRTWLGGPMSYASYFRDDFRDVQQCAAFLNDCADWVNEPYPFPKTFLQYLCACTQVKNYGRHNAVYDALATAQVYRRMMALRDHYQRIPPELLSP